MSGIAASRLSEERKLWRRDHPFGFIAKLGRNPDDSLNLFEWECAVPGMVGTAWEGGLYRLRLSFSAEYPSRPPECRFVPPIFHPNIYTDDGEVCLSLFDEHWTAAITIKQVLVGIQVLLCNPNPSSPANGEAAVLFSENPATYDEKIREIAQEFAADRMQLLMAE